MTGKARTTERRQAREIRASGGRLEGHAAVFGRPSEDLGGFIETIRPGAFARSLGSGRDVLALVGHDQNMVLGRRASGTLTLAEDETGLAYSIDPPPTGFARDLLVSVNRGDIAGASFSFRVVDEAWEFPAEGPAHRELIDVDLIEISIAAMPAYPDTSAAVRSLEAARARQSTRSAPSARGLALARAYLDTLED